MKKVFIIVVAFIFAFIFNELFVRYIIGYPTYGLNKKVQGISSRGWAYLMNPHSKYWNVEGGNIVEKWNNYGLPGNDIILNDSSKIIFLLGNSHIESLQVSREKMASTIFQNFLNNNGYNYTIVNLACSGHNAYDLYFRIKYFEKTFNPDLLILVLINSDKKRFKGYKDIDFNININAGMENTNSFYLIEKYLRNASASINLYRYLVRDIFSKENINKELIEESGNIIEKKYENKILDIVLTKYHEEYGNKFILMSVASEEEFNNHLKYFCTNLKINFACRNLRKPEFRFTGHFNEKGNYELGKFLFETFELYHKK